MVFTVRRYDIAGETGPQWNTFGHSVVSRPSPKSAVFTNNPVKYFRTNFVCVHGYFLITLKKDFFRNLENMEPLQLFHCALMVT